MFIAACLIWYDETPDDLHRMARSLKGFANGVVALDGAFKDFPVGPGQHSVPWSSYEQVRALSEGCALGDLELIVHQPAKLGKYPLGMEGNEVEKRNASIKVAGAAWQPDWVFNIDGDMSLYSYGNSREELKHTPCGVAMTDIEGQPSRHHLFRWSPTLEFYRAHWIIRDGKKLYSGSDQMRDNKEMFPNGLEPCLDLTDVLKFDHAPKADFWRRARQNQWYLVRDSRGIEAI